MKIGEALNLLKQVCAGYKGTLQEHQLLQEAIQLIEKECSDKKVDKKADS